MSLSIFGPNDILLNASADTKALRILIDFIMNTQEWSLYRSVRFPFFHDADVKDITPGFINPSTITAPQFQKGITGLYPWIPDGVAKGSETGDPPLKHQQVPAFPAEVARVPATPSILEKSEVIMNKLVILILVGAVAFFGYHYVQGTGPFGSDELVTLGQSEYEKGSSIEEVWVTGAFDPLSLVEEGQPTVIEFFSDACPGCKQLQGHLRQFVDLRPDVVVNQIKLDRYWNPETVEEAYGIHIRSIPHILIYGPDGRLIAADDGEGKDGFEFLYKWMNYEREKDWKGKRRKS